MCQINQSSPFAPESDAIAKFREELRNHPQSQNSQVPQVIVNPQSEAVLAVVKQLLGQG